MATGTDRKAQILDGATRLFAEQGYGGMTMKMLATECGITEPALYRHYASKEALYEAVLETLAARLNSEAFFASVSRSAGLEEVLSGLAEHVVEYYTRNADTYRLLLFSALNGHAKAKQVFTVLRGAYVKFLVGHLDRLYAEGKIVKKNNEITARCFVGMVFDCALSFTLWRGFYGKVYRPEETIANNVPIYVRGLTTESV